MQSISTPLNAMHEDGAWFARAHELRLWLVRCDGNLRKPIVTLVPKLEFHADNFSAWPLLVDAHVAGGADPGGWQVRANVLAADWARRVEAFAKDGVVQGSVAPVSAANGFAAFRATLGAIMAALAPPLRGLVVVLAPTLVEQPQQLEAALAQLIADPSLARVRWVLVLDVDVAVPAQLVASLGELALVGEYRVDDAEQARDLAAMLKPSDPARFGTAFPPGVTPPRRVDDPPPLPLEQRNAALAAAGISPALLDVAPHIRSKVLGAALAMKQGQGQVALAQQREARDLCAAAGLTELTAITTIALASYMSGLGQRGAAKQEVGQAITLARANAQPRVESQGHLALGLLHGLDHDHAAALRSYVDAATTAEAAKEPTLAIESWRMAGQHAAQIGQDEQAAQAFREALRVATGVPVEQQGSTSAPEAARQLAALCERHGMTAQAASLYDQADAMEAAAKPAPQDVQEPSDAGE